MQLKFFCNISGVAQAAFLAVVFATGSFAQGVAGLGAISGTVRDSSGAAVAGASVTISNSSNGVNRTLQTTGAGLFNDPALTPGAGYVVSVAKPGFAKWQTNPFDVAVGATVDFKVNLQIATATTQVEVTAEAPLVEDTKTGVDALITRDQI